MTLVAAAGGLVAGLLIGWLLVGRAGGTTDSVADWKTRLSARDHDLSVLQEEIAFLTTRLEAGGAAPTHEVTQETDVDVDALLEQLEAAEDELLRLRANDHDRDPAGTDISHKLEELEAELASAHSQLCPDPGAHESLVKGIAPSPVAARNGSVTAGQTEVVERDADDVDVETVPSGDDLTQITGVGAGLAKVLRKMGLTTFQDIVQMNDEHLASLESLLDGVASRAARDGWVASAAELDRLKHAADA